MPTDTIPLFDVMTSPQEAIAETIEKNGLNRIVLAQFFGVARQLYAQTAGIRRTIPAWTE